MKKSKNQKFENWNPGSNFDLKHRNGSNMNQQNEGSYWSSQNRNDQNRNESDYRSGSGFMSGQGYRREQDSRSRAFDNESPHQAYLDFDNQNEYSDNDNWYSEPLSYGRNTREEQDYNKKWYPREGSWERNQFGPGSHNRDEENRDQRNRQDFQQGRQNQYGIRHQDERDMESQRYQQSSRNYYGDQNFDNRQSNDRGGHNEGYMGQSEQRRGWGNYSSGEHQGNYGSSQNNNKGRYQERRNDSNRFEQQRGPNAGQYREYQDREYQGNGEGYSTINSGNRRGLSNKVGGTLSGARYTSSESNNYDNRSSYDHSDTDEDFEEEPISASANENKNGGNKKSNKSGKNAPAKGGKKG